MPPVKQVLGILLASVIVFLLSWLIFAKWGYFVYFYNKVLTPKVRLSPNVPISPIFTIDVEKNAAIKNLQINYAEKYKILVNRKARMSKLRTTRMQFERLRKISPYLYSDNSWLTKEFNECISEDVDILAKQVNTFNEIYDNDQKQLSVFNNEERKILIERFAIYKFDLNTFI